MNLYNLRWDLLATATQETLIMLVVSLIFTLLLGLPLGILLFITAPKQLLSHPLIYNTASFLVNIFRSLPFLILMIMLIPLTRFIVGTSIGLRSVIPALVIGAAPFFARLVENALREVDTGIIEAAKSMGTPLPIIIGRVLLAEARPSLIAATTVTAVALLSYTAMAGVVGGGGLGSMAVNYGYQRFQPEVTFATVIILLVIVQFIQLIGDYSVRYFTRK